MVARRPSPGGSARVSLFSEAVGEESDLEAVGGESGSEAGSEGRDVDERSTGGIFRENSPSREPGTGLLSSLTESARCSPTPQHELHGVDDYPCVNPQDGSIEFIDVPTRNAIMEISPKCLIDKLVYTEQLAREIRSLVPESGGRVEVDQISQYERSITQVWVSLEKVSLRDRAEAISIIASNHERWLEILEQRATHGEEVLSVKTEKGSGYPSSKNPPYGTVGGPSSRTLPSSQNRGSDRGRKMRVEECDEVPGPFNWKPSSNYSHTMSERLWIRYGNCARGRWREVSGSRESMRSSREPWRGI
jgi:hypothetical protein